MPSARPRFSASSGALDVGDGQLIHYWTSGNPAGQPVVMLHGGPGSGCSPAWAEFTDPATCWAVGFDQRGCGRSTPDAADPSTDLAVNTTGHLIGDIEALRRQLGISSWMVLGGSWGSILGLAYAEAHPDRVDAMVLFSVAGAGRREIEWITSDLRRVFPAEWQRFRGAASAPGDLVEAFAQLLADVDPSVRAAAAAAWCDWEDTHVSLAASHDVRYDDPEFRYRFARLVTHYWRHTHFLEEGQLLRDVGRLHGIPGALIQGRLDISSPPDVAWQLARAWPDSEFMLCDDATHGLRTPSMRHAVTSAVTRLASHQQGSGLS